MIRMILAVAAVLIVLGVTAAPVAEAQTVEGLTVSSTTVYTPDLADEQIDVASSYTMTNVQADEVIGGSVRSYYFNKWVIAVPATAIDFVAVSNGTQLVSSLDRDTETADVAFGTINLPFNLNYQQSVTIDVTYAIPGGEPRTEGAVARVNDSFLSFAIWAAGDPGNTEVRVYVPEGFTLDLQGDLDELQRVEGETYFEATEIAAPRDFFGQVFGRNDSGLLTQVAELPDAVATVRAWPDDPAWADFVVDAIEDDIPVIEDLTGIDWPAGDIEVIETVTPYLYGYGGWFNATSGVIEVGENLERDLILHELTHAWFNADLVDGRWITEGLAEEFASRTIEATSDTRPDPDVPDLDEPLRVQLSQWASPWTLNEEDAFAYELFHYNASWWVIRQITNDVGMDAFADVLVALHEHQLAYPNATTPADPALVNLRWTHFFDLLEHEAQATGLDELFSTYVLSADDAERLVQRRSALARFEELSDKTGSWTSPPAVANAMAGWRFDDAQQFMGLAIEVVAARDEVDQLAGELQLTIDHRARMVYETATNEQDLEAAVLAETQLFDALVQLRLDRSELITESESVGAIVAFEPMSYDDAIADIVEKRLAIGDVNRLVGEVETRATSLGLEAPAWPMEATTASSTDFGSVAALAEARLATLEEIDRASADVGVGRSFIQRVGLVGSNPSGQIDKARASFEADDLDDALEATATAESMIANAAATGRARLIWSSVIVGVAVLAVFATRRAFASRQQAQRTEKPTQ